LIRSALHELSGAPENHNYSGWSAKGITFDTGGISIKPATAWKKK